MRQRIWADRVAFRCGRRCLVVLVMAVLAAAAAGCGGSSQPAAGATTAPPGASASSATSAATTAGTTSAAAPNSAAAAQVERAFVRFFDGSTPAATKIGLVQNGQQFAAVIQAQATSELAKSTTVRVAKVTVTSPTTATAVYTILLGGKPALANQAGQAVLVNGTWKVAATTFCQLLALEGQKVPGCPGAG
jgi:hypothetical protein